MSLPKYYVKANTYSNISPYPSWRRDFDYWQKDLTTNLYYLQGNVGIGYSVVHGGFVVSSNIGIGTNNPIGKLDVVGNVVVDSGSASTPSFSFRDNTTTGIYQPTTNTLAFSTNGNQRMIIDASGNLILNNNLVVNGSTVSMNTDTVTINDPIITLGNNTSTDIYDRGVDFKWYNGAEVKNGFIGFKQSSGNFVLYNDASNINNVYNGTTGSLQIKSLVCDVSMGIAPLTITSSTLVINLNADLLDGLTGSQFMRSDISTSCLGNISGANITASDTISGSILISNIASGTAPLIVTSSTLVTNLNVDLLDGLNNTQFMRSDISTSCLGNIGIGTTNPQATLDVSGTILSKFIKIQNTGLNSYVNIKTDTSVSGFDLVSEINTNNAYIIQRDNASMIFRTNDSERMRVDANGNVGIGIITPSAALDVSGNLNYTGNLYKSGIIYTPENITMNDTRSVNTNPVDLPIAMRSDFKTNTVNGLSDGGTYNVVVSLKHPSGIVNQLGLTENNNLWLRSGGNTTWNAWKRVMATLATTATGGNSINNIRGYKIHTFTGSGSFIVTSPGEIEYLVVAGGGGGATNADSANRAGGGGGAGGVLEGRAEVSIGTYTIIVGGGGAKPANSTIHYQVGTSGSDSSISSIVTTTGGGRGGAGNNQPPFSGGSGGGGGAGATPSNGASGTLPQGYAGGSSLGTESINGASGAGGGGAGGPGQNWSTGFSNITRGGPGRYSSISGTNEVYGIGGDSTYSNIAFVSRTNFGDGGSAGNTGGPGPYAGGSGIVIIRYLL